MSFDAIIPVLVCVQTLIMLGGIPWAMSVYTRLAKLEVAIDMIVPYSEVARRSDMTALGATVQETRTDQSKVHERLAVVERDVEQLMLEHRKG